MFITIPLETILFFLFHWDTRHLVPLLRNCTYNTVIVPSFVACSSFFSCHPLWFFFFFFLRVFCLRRETPPFLVYSSKTKQQEKPKKSKELLYFSLKHKQTCKTSPFSRNIPIVSHIFYSPKTVDAKWGF